MSNLAGETTLLETNPVMFRNSPLLFVLCVLAILLGGLGLLLLGIWWLNTKGSTLTITDKRTIQRRGLFSKHTTEVVHRDVRNIQVSQSIFQRIFDVGNLGISSAGQSGVEIQFNGLRDPEDVKMMIDRYRNL
jgi:uncharacterized membrane protein YdbT with pleckstrin-like domain